MSGEYYKIKYNAMDQLYVTVSTRINDWYTQLDNWVQSYTTVVNMNSFEGTSATGAKTYLQEVHGILLYAIQQTLSAYQSNFLLY